MIAAMMGVKVLLYLLVLVVIDGSWILGLIIPYFLYYWPVKWKVKNPHNQAGPFINTLGE